VDTIEILAIVAACLVAVVVGFHLAFTAGAPWAAAAYGGRAILDDGTLPARYRVASVISALVLLGALWLILVARSVISRGPVPDRVPNVGA
jgi:H+/Cl- antiporter ClcA